MPTLVISTFGIHESTSRELLRSGLSFSFVSACCACHKGWGFLNAAAFDGDLFVHRDNLLMTPEQLQEPEILLFIPIRHS